MNRTDQILPIAIKKLTRHPVKLGWDVPASVHISMHDTIEPDQESGLFTTMANHRKTKSLASVFQHL